MQFSYEDSDSAQIAVNLLITGPFAPGENCTNFHQFSTYFAKSAYCRSVFPRRYKIVQVKEGGLFVIFLPLQ